MMAEVENLVLIICVICVGSSIAWKSLAVIAAWPLESEPSIPSTRGDRYVSIASRARHVEAPDINRDKGNNATQNSSVARRRQEAAVLSGRGRRFRMPRDGRLSNASAFDPLKAKDAEADRARPGKGEA
jgi:hypothetical protein